MHVLFEYSAQFKPSLESHRRTAAVWGTRAFLESLASGDASGYTPEEMAGFASRLLTHFPTASDLKRASEEAPQSWGLIEHEHKDGLRQSLHDGWLAELKQRLTQRELQRKANMQQRRDRYLALAREILHDARSGGGSEQGQAQFAFDAGYFALISVLPHEVIRKVPNHPSPELATKASQALLLSQADQELADAMARGRDGGQVGCSASTAMTWAQCVIDSAARHQFP